MLVSIDPGVRGCGVALWEENKLLTAGYIQGSTDSKQRDVTWRVMVTSLRIACLQTQEVVIEFPQAYSVRSLQKGDQNDLLMLAGTVAAIVTHIGDKTTLYLPREWKQQVPKTLMCQRIEKRLSSEERTSVVLPKNKRLQLDVWDAIGIGLFHLGRL